MAEPMDNVRFAMEGEVLALHPAPSNDMALNSIAISLKRIADALTGDGPNIFNASLNSYGEGIGECIQGQMIRGSRGIDQYERR